MTHLPKYALPRLGKTELVAMVNNIFFDQVCFRLIFPFHNFQCVYHFNHSYSVTEFGHSMAAKQGHPSGTFKQET